MTLADYLLTTTPLSKAMHLMHCTTVASGFAVLGDLELRPTSCKVYGADLLYLFYGRPAFKPAADVGASGILDLAPICLVLDPALLGGVIRCVPFDSGGFARYAPLLGPGFTREDFELAADPSAPLRLVDAFYRSARAYYDQMPALREGDLPLSRRSARAYARLIADPAIRDTDDRASTIELQFDRPVPLSDALRALVAPASMLEDEEVKAALDVCPHAAPVPYRTYGRFNPLSLAHTIYERVDTVLDHLKDFA